MDSQRKMSSDASPSFQPIKRVVSEKEVKAMVLADKPPAQALRVALVGLGRAGGFHMQSMRLLGPHVVKLAWAIDMNEARAAEVGKEFGAKHGTKLTEALADPEVDAVIVASTTDTHFAFCKEALEANKCLLTEKPISHDPKEVQQILDLAKEKKVPFIVGYQRRCDKNFRRMHELVKGGVIGEPRIIRCTSRDNPLPPLPYLETSGGIFHDMLSHDFDMLNYLTGQIPKSVYSIGHCYVPEIKAMNDVDTVVCTLDFESGLLATVDTSRVAAYGYDQRVEVFGATGMVSMNNETENTVELATTEGFLKPVAEWSFPQRYKHTYTIELADKNMPEPKMHFESGCNTPKEKFKLVFKPRK